MLCPRNHDDRQFLRPRPIVNRLNRERFRRFRRESRACFPARVRLPSGLPPCRRTRSARSPGLLRAASPPRATTRRCRTKNPPARGADRLARLRAHVIEHGTQVVALADAGVMLALRFTDTAKIRAVGHVVQLHERARERLRDLVVHRAAEQRVRMRDERDAARRGAALAHFVGQIQRDFDLADRAVDQDTSLYVRSWRGLLIDFQTLDDLAVHKVRIDDFIDVAFVDVRVPDALRDKRRARARVRSDRGSRPC